MTGLRLVTTEEPERIGEVGTVWARRFAGGWTVYGYQSGVIVRNITRPQAEAVIARFEQARATHPSTGGSA